MTKESINQYQEGHLFVAAIRILEHQNSTLPTLEEISEILGFSVEQTGLISRRLADDGIVRMVESAFDDRWGVDDHLKIETLPKEAAASELDDALKQFKAEKSKMAQKIESIKEQQAKKQQELFSEIEKKLKKNLGDETP